VDLVDWTTNINNLNTGAGGWNITAIQSMSHPLIGPTAYKPLIYTMPQIGSDPELDDAFGRFFKGKDVEQRKNAWSDIEKRVFDQVYIIKIGDYGSSLIVNSRVNNIRPWYTNRYWDVWLSSAKSE
jgi:peptide/nickel transport system substrate-binding protein